MNCYICRMIEQQHAPLCSMWQAALTQGTRSMSVPPTPGGAANLCATLERCMEHDRSDGCRQAAAEALVLALCDCSKTSATALARLWLLLARRIAAWSPQDALAHPAFDATRAAESAAKACTANSSSSSSSGREGAEEVRTALWRVLDASLAAGGARAALASEPTLLQLLVPMAKAGTQDSCPATLLALCEALQRAAGQLGPLLWHASKRLVAAAAPLMCHTHFKVRWWSCIYTALFFHVQGLATGVHASTPPRPAPASNPPLPLLQAGADCRHRRSVGAAAARRTRDAAGADWLP